MSDATTQDRAGVDLEHMAKAADMRIARLEAWWLRVPIEAAKFIIGIRVGAPSATSSAQPSSTARTAGTHTDRYFGV